MADIRADFNDYRQTPRGQLIAHGQWSRATPLNHKLHMFAAFNLASDFERALEKGADINFTNDMHGNDSLLFAVSHSAVDVAVWLARHAAEKNFDLNRQDRLERDGEDGDPAGNPRHWPHDTRMKNTGLILAVKKGWDHVATGYLDEPYAICVKPLSAAIRALLAAGADPDLQDGYGNTALHIATMRRDLPCIKALRQAGARTDIRNRAGLAAADMLDVPWEEIRAFLHAECGDDAGNFTLQDRKSWTQTRHWARFALVSSGPAPSAPVAAP